MDTTIQMFAAETGHSVVPAMVAVGPFDLSEIMASSALPSFNRIMNDEGFMKSLVTSTL